MPSEAALKAAEAIVHIDWLTPTEINLLAAAFDAFADERVKEMSAVVMDLRLLCYRTKRRMEKGRIDDAKELLSHADRLAEKAGVRPEILRDFE